jgi:uncharacterized protein (DUF1778 family)
MPRFEPQFGRQNRYTLYMLCYGDGGPIAMATKNPVTHAKPVNLRIREDVRILIDRAAKVRGKTRSDFMIDAAYRAAEDTLLDQTLVKVDPESYRHYLDILDRPTEREGFARLMNAPKPWKS